MRSLGSWVLAALLSACAGSGNESVPDFVAQLPRLGAASSRQDSAMRALARDLEAWAARAGRPAAAEALLGPMLLHSSRHHGLPSPADTGLEASYQRLEARFAELLVRGDSLSHAAEAAQAQLVAWAGRAATPAGDRTDQFRTAVFPPAPDDPGRGAVAQAVKCSVITVSVLPSKEGVRFCVLKQKICSRMPADDIGDAWWQVQCIQSCFDYIGWVPEGGDFTVGSR